MYDTCISDPSTNGSLIKILIQKITMGEIYLLELKKKVYSSLLCDIPIQTGSEISRISRKYSNQHMKNITSLHVPHLLSITTTMVGGRSVPRKFFYPPFAPHIHFPLRHEHSSQHSVIVAMGDCVTQAVAKINIPIVNHHSSHEPSGGSAVHFGSDERPQSQQPPSAEGCTHPLTQG